MACKGCQKKKNRFRSFNNSVDANVLFATGQYHPVIYKGTTKVPTRVGSTTGVTLLDKLPDYGLAIEGALLMVHKADVEDRPQLFQTIEKSDERYTETLDSYNIKYAE